MTFMLSYLKRGDNFIDAGANVGMYTLLASSIVGKDGGVDAVEPCQKTLERLHENLQLNKIKQVRVHDAAVGEVDGIVRFLSDRDVTNRIYVDIDGNEPTIEVRCVRLDTVIQNRAYSMGKMDLEGGEFLALKGCVNNLRIANPPVWLLEVTDKISDYGFTQDELADWLELHGYDMAIFDGKTGQLHFGRQLWLRKRNVLAIARSAQDQVRKRLRSRNAVKSEKEQG
ncbi:unnamed protein product [marine sediment metagenome]|uniref:Methyltransferase FkbM domain-containing protein n=1 Tax=marine sediment metagenome TaxID=412755 RepID=X0SGH3_9ZZZZ